jgi:hypothetical protein
LFADLESEKILSIGKLMAELSSFQYVENSAFFHYNSGKKGAREMILTFLNFFRRGLPTHKKISFLGGPAHFVTYGGGDDGLVHNNNALTTMASALKTEHNWHSN